MKRPFDKIREEIGAGTNFISITFQGSREVSEFFTRTDLNFTHGVDSKVYIKEFGFFRYPKTLISNKNLIIATIEKMISERYCTRRQNRFEFEAGTSNQLTKKTLAIKTSCKKP